MVRRKKKRRSARPTEYRQELRRNEAQRLTELMQGAGHVLLKCGIPENVISDQDAWRILVDRGVLSNWNPIRGRGFEIEQLSRDDAENILALLETELDFKARSQSGLYLGIMDRFEKWEDKFLEYVTWCKYAHRQLMPDSGDDPIIWLDRFQQSFNEVESKWDFFSKSPAAILVSLWLVPVATPKLSNTQMTLARRDHQKSLEFPSPRHLYEDAAYDWKAARNRIEQVFDKWNMTPPWLE